MKYDLMLAALRCVLWAGLACLATLLLYRGDGRGLTARGLVIRGGFAAGVMILIGLLLSFSGLYGPIGLLSVLAILSVTASWCRARRNAEQADRPTLQAWIRGRCSGILVALVGILDRLEEGTRSHPRLVRRWLRGLFRAPRGSRRRRMFMLLLIATAAFMLRIISLVTQPMSVTSSWFGAVQKIEDLRLQNVLGEIHQLPGYHALIRVFSDLTQTRVEFMLLIAEGMAALLGALLAYRLVRRLLLTRAREEVRSSSRLAHYGGLAAASAWALAPLFVTDEAFTHNIYYTRLVLGLTLGACALLLLRGEGRERSIPGGPTRIMLPVLVLATALTDLMAFGLLLSGGAVFLLERLASVPFPTGRRKPGAASRLTLFGIGAAAGATSYMALVQGYGMDYREFFLSQLFHPEIYFGNLEFTVLQRQLLWGIIGAGVLGSLARAALRTWRGGIRSFPAAECVFMLCFLALALLNRHAPALREEWTQLPQVPVLLSLAAAVAFGLLIRHLGRTGQGILSRALQQPAAAVRWAPRTLLGGTVALLLLSGLRPAGIPAEEPPDALPVDFFTAFYRISSERIPTSYSVIAPAAMRPLTVNRSRFLDYPFFLQNYARLDSLYRRTKALGEGRPGAELQYEYRPSPHVFLFIAKPPYKFQQSNIPQLQQRMSDMRRWVQNFQARGGRADVYYESSHSVVYQLKYETGYALIDESLYRSHSDKPWTLFEE